MVEIKELLEKKRDLNISKRRKSLHSIKDEIEEIPDIKKIADKFESKCHSHVCSILKDDLVSKEMKKQIQELILKAAQHHSELKEGTLITDNLSILAYYLPQLKINLIRRDDKTIGRLNKKYMKNNTSISKTIKMIEKFGDGLQNLNSVYDNIFSIVNNDLPLESSVKMNEIKHCLYIDKLYDCHKTHKEMVYHIGKEFVDISNKLK